MVSLPLAISEEGLSGDGESDRPCKDELLELLTKAAGFDASYSNHIGLVNAVQAKEDGIFYVGLEILSSQDYPAGKNKVFYLQRENTPGADWIADIAQLSLGGRLSITTRKEAKFIKSVTLMR